MGASLGLAVRQAKLFQRVVGCERDWSTARRARKLGVVDKEYGNVEDAVRDADAVIVTTPPSAMRETFQAMAPLLKPGAVVSDTAATKREVLAWADEVLPRGVSFVGGHPLVDDTNPDADPSAAIFNGRVYCLVPSVHADGSALDFMKRFAEALGCENYFIDPEEHDSFAAAALQLPRLSSAALANLMTRNESWREISKFAAEPFDQQARLGAALDPVQLRDECFTNRENLARWIDLYVAKLLEWRRRITAQDPDLARDLEQDADRMAAWRHRKRQGHEYPGHESRDLAPPPIPRGIFSLGGFGFGRRGERTEEQDRPRP